jgi:hypothetical protein
MLRLSTRSVRECVQRVLSANSRLAETGHAGIGIYVPTENQFRGGLPLIENLLGDLRNAALTISRMPGLAAVIIL